MKLEVLKELRPIAKMGNYIFIQYISDSTHAVIG